MPITVGPNIPVAQQAAVARAIGRSQGAEAARQQIFQEGVQQTQLDQNQQTIDQRDRLAVQGIEASRELEQLRQSGDIGRIGYEFDRRAQEAQRTQQLNELAAGRQFEYQQVSQWMGGATPEGRQAIRANIQREQQIRQGIGTLYTPEQAAPLAQEVLAERQQIMANPAFTQDLSPQAIVAQQTYTDENGTTWRINPATGEVELGQRWDQSRERYQMAAEQARYDAELKARAAAVNDLALQLGRSPTVDEVNTRMRLLTPSGFAPGESGGMPDMGPPQGSNPLFDAARAAGVDLSQPPTPETLARLQQAMQAPQAAQQPSPVQQQPDSGVYGPPAPGDVPASVRPVASRAYQRMQNGVDVMQAVVEAMDATEQAMPLATAVAREAAATIENSPIRPVTEAVVGAAINNALNSLRNIRIRGLGL